MEMSQGNLVYIIDDDPIICESVQMLLSSVGVDAQTYSSAPAFLKHAEAFGRAFGGGCVVADVNMPEMSGIELVAELKQFPCAPPVILMTGDNDVSLVFQAMRAGALDVLEKPISPDRLICAVRLALADKEEEEAQKVKKEAFIAWLSELNNTEKEVLDGIIRGKTIKTIALELGVDLKTVELHRANAMSKLNVRNLPELLRLSFIASRDAFPGSVQT
jgi:two-component system response regulator FixJ